MEEASDQKEYEAVDEIVKEKLMKEEMIEHK